MLRAMRNPRPVCPNSHCVNHRNPPAGFYRKKGYRRPAHNRQPIPRYQCRACDTYFCATQTKPFRQHHRPDLNAEVFRLAVSGVTMARMETLLGCAKRTIARKINHLAKEAQKHHTAFLANPKNHTAHAMMDELETFIHARWKQVSVPVVIRAKNGHILAFDVCRKPTQMVRTNHAWSIDHRPQVVPRVLAAASVAFKPGAVLTTDGGSSYPKWIRASGIVATHRVQHTPVGNTDYDPLFAINLLFAKVRNDLARLSRRTWTTSKTEAALRNHLWLYVAWTNGYRLR